MIRPPVQFTHAHASHIHAILSDLVPMIGEPGPYNRLGVDSSSLGPTLMPVRQVLDGSEHAEVKTAVYVVTDEDRTVRYVGSVDRRTPALRRRLATHFAERRAESIRAWTRVGLVLMPEDFTHQKVLLCEGWVGRVLDPLDNDRLPCTGMPWTPRPGAA
ncbi:GIY-YIG nuclease family protein [Crossiella sp. SN42]|uniref:GIY-YIG nuclease family protein n=1 Tax=Crossiella sp. SN42 TaxID=2944808 RepID=UPI00207C8B09|nr:GIY-YIG nuclease family protein [Crossiella sp. SN42]MCO1575109.1 GIY-YIG nuclease family protein [Crossiella sp. SN42]